MFEILPIPAFKDNYIWLLVDGCRAAVVDPGDPAPVIEQLQQRGLSLESILITHHHADHQGGVPALLEHWAAAVFAPENESITGRTRGLCGGESIQVLGQHMQVMAVPGHTLGHLAYALPGVLFCGDTLFGAGCGRLFEGTPAQMFESLQQIAALPDETRIYCAHEYTAMNLPFALAVEPQNQALQTRAAKVAALRQAGQPTVPLNLAEEKATNPFLRCAEPAVIAKAKAMGVVNDDFVSVFAAIRQWRNTF